MIQANVSEQGWKQQLCVHRLRINQLTDADYEVMPSLIWRHMAGRFGVKSDPNVTACYLHVFTGSNDWKKR